MSVETNSTNAALEKRGCLDSAGKGDGRGTRPAKPLTLVVMEHAPPRIGGTPAVMHEILREIPLDSYVIVTKVEDASASRDDRSLDAVVVEIHLPRALDFFVGFRFLVICPLLIRLAKKIQKKTGRDLQLLAVFPSLDFLLSSMIASRILNARVFTYLHDCITETSIHGLDPLPARIAERLVFRISAEVFALSEAMRLYYSRKHLTVTSVLPHPVDASLLVHAPAHNIRDKPIVGFAGMLYQTNDTAFNDLLLAKDKSNDGFEIRVATSKETIAYLNRTGKSAMINQLVTLDTHAELIEFLSECDMLFLPLNFESILEKDLLTIFPTKVTDYWLAQRPIIVYGPEKYSFVREAKAEGYGYIVSNRDVDGILRGISDLNNSSDLRSSLVLESLRLVKEHDGKEISHRLAESLGLQPEYQSCSD